VSIRLMSIVWELDLSPSEKLVLLALADQASDEGRQCWPSVARIVQRCGLAERTVRQVLGALEDRGHLTRHHRDGNSTHYRVHPRRPRTPAAAALRRELPVTPAAAAGKSSGTVKPKTIPPPAGRASRVPDGFAPAMTGKTGAVVAQWPPGRLADEVERFIDHHRAKGTLSFDWQASWRSWVRLGQTWERPGGTERQPRSGAASGRREPQPDPILAALRRAVADERAERGEADHPRARAALPAGLG
jgi:hypothetical protein